MVGDDFYGLLGELKPDRDRSLVGTAAAPPISPFIARQALHAAEISFAHPITSEWQTFSAPLPDDMQHAIDLVKAI